MRIQSGMVKANKKDIEAIRVFLEHARQDIGYGGNGTYCKSGSIENELDLREIQKGEQGLQHVEFLLEGLCDKWN